MKKFPLFLEFINGEFKDKAAEKIFEILDDQGTISLRELKEMKL